jgi:hypothetical protein
MKSPQPNLCKLEGPMSICHSQAPNIKKEQENCSTYKKGRKGFCTSYHTSIGACSNFDGYLSVKTHENNNNDNEVLLWKN